MNLLYRISRAFEGLETYRLIPNLHSELKESIQYWITNTSKEELCKRHKPLKMHEHRDLSNSDWSKYSEINRILDELYAEIYHMQTINEYREKCKDLASLIRSEYMINLLLNPAFIDVLCKKIDEKKIALSDINTLMIQFGKGKQIFLEAAQDTDNKIIYSGLRKLLTSLNSFIESVDDILWLYYLQELRNRLNTCIEDFERRSEQAGLI